MDHFHKSCWFLRILAETALKQIAKIIKTKGIFFQESFLKFIAAPGNG